MAAQNKIICSIFLALLGLGFYDVFRNFEENGCTMTYMFQWPSYIDAKLDDAIQQRFPQYSLSLYGEGDYLKRSRNLKLNGIPVLFIPGNAGSFKQVRSLGSVALRKAEAYSFHFNYFTINFKEELTGIYGGALQKQTEYVHECIKYILTLYKHKKNTPTSVVLVGHSMGGVIARALFMLPEFQPSLVHTVFTQATPHVSPVIGADKYLVDFYGSVNKYWKEHIHSSRLKDVTLLSVSGGHRDTMVRSGLTSLLGVVPSSRSLSVNAMSVPRVWLSTDHQCVVWCKELVLATNRALFQMVDSKTKQISTDPEYRMKILRHHFVAHNGKEKFSTIETKPATFEGATFELVTDSQKYSVGKRSKKTIHYLFPVEQSDVSQSTFVALAGITPRDWLFVCKEGNSTLCSKGIDISATARLIPPLKSDMKEAIVKLDDYPEAKNVILKVPSGSKNSEDKVNQILMRSLKKISFNWAICSFLTAASASIVMEFTDVGATFYNITMLDFNLFHLAYEARLEPLICDNDFHSDANTTLRLHIPWAEGQDMFSVSKAGQTNKLSLKLPSGWPSYYNQSAQLYTYLNPKCRYTIRVVWSLQEKMGQVVRFHANLLPNFLVIVLVYLISFQLKHIYTEKAIDDFIWMQSTYCKPTAIALPISIFRGLVKYPPLDQTFQLRSLEDRNISFPILPMAFFLFAYALLTQLAILTNFKVGICARLAVILKGTKPDEHLLNPAGPTPWLMYGIIAGLIALSATTCGSLGLILVLILYFFKVVGLKAKVIRLSHCLNIHGAVPDTNASATPTTKGEVDMPTDAKNISETDENPSATNSDEVKPSKPDDAAPKPRDLRPLGLAKDMYNFHFAVMLLLWCLCMLNVPALVVWFKNLGHSLHLSQDPSLVISAIVCSSMATLLDGRYAMPTSKGLCKLSSWMFHIFLWLMVLYTLESTYLLSYFIGSIFVILSLLHIFQ
ncbi:GPI inositol-deacylase-like [Acanthaster planci]|uniref:GPI inositol-deacylase n=1 Tax=Acanthaster planci TaxID=133434 RepID=A0A8B7Z852_ACAPL|nr:GPI inositol-deacylase-like [Acanthaster planci]